MAFTIKRMKQPFKSSFMKRGGTFFRVKKNGEFVQDFRMKFTASKFVKTLKKREKEKGGK